MVHMLLIACLKVWLVLSRFHVAATYLRSSRLTPHRTSPRFATPCYDCLWSAMTAHNLLWLPMICYDSLRIIMTHLLSDLHHTTILPTPFWVFVPYIVYPRSILYAKLTVKLSFPMSLLLWYLARSVTYTNCRIYVKWHVGLDVLCIA